METLWHDLRHSLRTLVTNRSFAILSIATVALTIAGVTVVATLIYSVLLKPLPYTDPDRLVILWEKQPQLPTLRTVRAADFMDWRYRSHSFELMGLYRASVYNIDNDTAPVRAQVWSVTPNVFPMLGARMAIGRGLQDDDERADAAAVAVISYEFWQVRYGGAPDVLGRTLQLPQNTVVTIVGVVAPGFQLPIPASTPRPRGSPTLESSPPEIWQAYRPTAAELSNRLRGSYTAIAKLKPGATVAMANAEIAAIAKELTAQHPETNENVSAGAAAVVDEVVGGLGSILWIFFGAVLCVLMIGVGNVVNLQTIRNSARERETSIRAALGASQPRLLRLHITESVVMSSIGCIVGLLAAAGGIGIVIRYLPAGFPRLAEVRMDLRVALFSFAISIIAGVAFGSIPAFRISRHDLNEVLKGASGAISADWKRMRVLRSFVGFEAALAMVLLIGAALLTNSLWRLVTADTGMNESNVWIVAVTLPAKYRTQQDQSRFFLSALDRARNLPGIDSAGLVSAPPLAGIELMLPNAMGEQRANSSNRDGVTLSLRIVTPDYFRVIGIVSREGRLLEDSDTTISDHVAVVNESAARSLWPADNPIGKQIVAGRRYTVVGVITDIKMRGLDIPPSPQVYSNFLQEPVGTEMPITLMARSHTRNRAFGAAIRNAVLSLDPEVNVSPATMGDVRWSITATERFRTTVILVFASIALFLALVGIFAVVSFTVAQRKREIGLRVALGAERATILALMVRQSLIPAVVGVLTGVIVSLWMTRLLSGLLYDVSPTDRMTFVVASIVLITSTAAASYLPARRALRVDPAIALRHD